jgi:histidinol-phosphatase (PHP family)
VLKFDHHTHHNRCGHARGSVEDYIVAALRLGLDEIGITDHAPLYWLDGDYPHPGSAMARSHLPEYVEEVLKLKLRYQGRIRVLLGLEVDYIPGAEALYRKVLSPYPWDYLIGSVHYVHDLHIYHHARWQRGAPADEQYAAYFELVRGSARAGLFDVLGHITGLLAYGPAMSPALQAREFSATAVTIATSGVAIEINASGLRKGGPEPFPHGELLRSCIEAGVPLTYGSDSHLIEEVGHARDIATRLMAQATVWRPSNSGAVLRQPNRAF